MFLEFQVVETRWKITHSIICSLLHQCIQHPFVEEEKSPNTSCDDFMAIDYNLISKQNYYSSKIYISDYNSQN
jgi:hypothetical protein